MGMDRQTELRFKVLNRLHRLRYEFEHQLAIAEAELFDAVAKAKTAELVGDSDTNDVSETKIFTRINKLVNIYNNHILIYDPNNVKFSRFAEKLPQIVNVSSVYDGTTGCYDIVLKFRKPINTRNKREAEDILRLLFSPILRHDLGSEFRELLDTCAVNNHTISFWHGRLQNMGIHTGQRDKKIK